MLIWLKARIRQLFTCTKTVLIKVMVAGGESTKTKFMQEEEDGKKKFQLCELHCRGTNCTRLKSTLAATLYCSFLGPGGILLHLIFSTTRITIFPFQG